MNRNTFAAAMEQLGAEASAEQLREEQLMRRRRTFAVIRKVFGFLIFAGLVGGGYYYRQPLQDYCYDHFFQDKKSTAETVAQGTLTEVQAQSAKREAILDEIESKGKSPTTVAEAK